MGSSQAFSQTTRYLAGGMSSVGREPPSRTLALVLTSLRVGVDLFFSLGYFEFVIVPLCLSLNASGSRVPGAFAFLEKHLHFRQSLLAHCQRPLGPGWPFP